jgi:adenylate kinase
MWATLPRLGDWNDNYESLELDEDKLIDELEDVMAEGNVLVEHHVTDIFPERWFDAIFVLRTDLTKLYDRLATRKYNEKKLQDNIQCEIFQTILEEANESYKPEIVHEHVHQCVTKIFLFHQYFRP